jgi:Ca2+-binding RTX toxin-like protein
MTTFTVTTLADENDAGATVAAPGGTGLSLREALALANANPDEDTIEFAAGLLGGTITLGGSQLEITTSVTIDGDIADDGAADITIDADGLSRVFQVQGGGSSELFALVITGGDPGDGNDMDGGGVRVQGAGTELLIDNSTLTGNATSDRPFNNRGSAFYGDAGTIVTITDSLISFNNGAGGIGTVSTNGTLNLDDVVIAFNTAELGSGIHVVDLPGQSNNPVVNATNITLTGNRDLTTFALEFEELFAERGTINISNSIVANTGGIDNVHATTDGVINLDPSVILSMAPTTNSNGVINGTATIEPNLLNIFATTDTNGPVTGGALADNGEVVQTVALAPGVTVGAFSNDEPTINGLGPTLFALEGAEINFDLSSATIADAEGDTVTLTIEVDSGSFDAPSDGAGIGAGVTEFVVDGQTITLTGSAADINTYLDTFTIAYTGAVGVNGFGAATLTLTPSDTGVGEPDVISLNIIEAGSLVVTTLNDVDDDLDGLTSLREAIAFAETTDATDDVITFDPSLAGGTITLVDTFGADSNTDLDIDFNAGTVGALTIDGDIDGDGTPDVTIDGNGTNRVIDITGANTDVTLNGLTITGGDAVGLESGGGIRQQGGSELTISDSVITGNTAEDGGGIVSEDGGTTLTITGSTISDNNAATGFGGGLFTFNGTNTTISDSTFSGNTGGAGGGLQNRGGVLTVTNSTFSDNTAANFGGGGIYTDSFGGNVGDATLTNVTVVGNSGRNGAGIYANNGNLSVVNSTITGNTVTAGGPNGGAFGVSNLATVDITNSIILGNSGLGGAIAGSGAPNSITNSITSGAAAGVFASIDPATGGGRLADNGGSVQTVALNSNFNNPALDIGMAPVGLLTDANGNPRDIDQADADNGGTVDAGAVELQANANTPPAFQFNTVTFDEEVTGALVATFDRTDSDGDVLSYSLSFASDSALFQIVDNELRLASNASVNFEAGSAFSVAITARDSQGLTNSSFVTVTVSDVIEGDQVLFAVDSTSGNLFSGEGNDSLDGDLRANILDGDEGNDTLRGNDGNDTLRGDEGGDFISAGVGDDIAFGGVGNDEIFAGPGDTGNDMFQGDEGNDVIGGGIGNDTLVGGTNGSGPDGADTLFGGAGADLVVTGNFNDVNSNGQVDSGEISGDGADEAYSGSGDDKLYGAGGNDILGGGAGSDSINAGAGNDIIYGGAPTTGATSDDTIDGGAGNDEIFAGDGNDSILGGDGDDILFNGVGDDTVNGGAGDDTLFAGPGDDFLTGGSGADTFAFFDGSGDDIIADFDLVNDTLDLSGLTNPVDLMTASDSANGLVIDLGDGNSITLDGITTADIGSINVLV